MINKTNSQIHASMMVGLSTTPEEMKIRGKVEGQDYVVSGGKVFSISSCQDSLLCSSVKEVVEFLKGNCTTGGMSVQYARNPSTNEIIRVVKIGKPCQKDVRSLYNFGFTEWTFSWAWAPDNFLLPNGEMVKVSREIDLSPVQTLKTAIGYVGLLY